MIDNWLMLQIYGFSQLKQKKEDKKLIYLKIAIISLHIHRVYVQK